MEIYEAILEAIRENRSYALATIVRTIGVTPRSAGTKMLVYADGSILGTIGGSDAELQAIRDCRAAIASGETMLRRYVTDSLGDPTTEKAIEVFIEPGRMKPRLYLLGSGHVAQAVLPLAKGLGYHIVVMDDRDNGAFAHLYRDADEMVHVDSFLELKDMAIVPGSYFVLCSHSQETDRDAMEAVMGKQAAYIGMLGGKHKILPIFRYLQELGYTSEEIERIHAPIGLDIGGETPEEIALGIMAEITAVRYGRTAEPLRAIRNISASL